MSTNPKQAIDVAYERIVQHMSEQRDRMLAEAEERPEDYDGISQEDAFVWFIESF